MAVKVVLILSIFAQIAAALLALRLNARYRRQSAWLLVSAAAIGMAIRRLATLVSVWYSNPEELAEPSLYTASLATLLVSVLFLAGMSLIEPLFRQIAEAQDVLQREKRRLERVVHDTEEELQLARRIQRNLLPKAAPEIPGLEVAGSSRPAEWTSGDYFDYLPVADGGIVVLVADVSGHGTGPALLMSETRALVRALAQTHSDVGTILTLANRAIFEDVADGQFVTMFMARVDAKSGRLCYAGAGHAAYVLDRRGNARTLDSTSVALGMTADATMTDVSTERVDVGDILLLMTDGIPETESAHGDQFGPERALEVVRENRQKSAAQIVDSLFQSARRFAGGAPQLDDNTAVVIKVLAGESTEA